jgi:hypothetical protein
MPLSPKEPTRLYKRHPVTGKLMGDPLHADWPEDAPYYVRFTIAGKQYLLSCQTPDRAAARERSIALWKQSVKLRKYEQRPAGGPLMAHPMVVVPRREGQVIKTADFLGIPRSVSLPPLAASRAHRFRGNHLPTVGPTRLIYHHTQATLGRLIAAMQTQWRATAKRLHPDTGDVRGEFAYWCDRVTFAKRYLRSLFKEISGTRCVSAHQRLRRNRHLDTKEYGLRDVASKCGLPLRRVQQLRRNFLDPSVTPDEKSRLLRVAAVLQVDFPIHTC